MKSASLKVDHNFHLIENDQAKDWEKRQPWEYHEYRRMWNENPKNDVLGAVPLHLDIEATSDCNLKCTMCPRTEMVNAGRFWQVESFSMGLFFRLIDEASFKGLKSLKLQYLGEPLLNPNIFEMVKYAKSKGIIDVMFNTNATSLTKAKIEKIFESGLDKLFFSFDSPNKEHYEKIRVNANYDKVLRNIRNFSEAKRQRGLDKPFTRVSMVKLPGFEDEWKQFQELFEPLVDGIAALDEMDHSEPTEHFEDPFSSEVMLKVKQQIEDEKIAVDARWNSDSLKPEFCCPQLWQRMFIHPDGLVTPCCVDSYRTLKMGNIHESSIEEIWHGEQYQYLREIHRSGNRKLIETCRRCGLANL